MSINTIQIRKYYEHEEVGKNWQKVNRNQPCPICQHKDWCLYSSDGRVAICMRVASDQTVNAKSGGWLHKNPFSDSIATYFQQKREWQEPEDNGEFKPIIAKGPATPQQCDRFHKWLLERYPLSRKDEDFLRASGIKDISDYGTLPNPGKWKCYHLPREFPEGIAGVYRDRYDKQQFLSGMSYGIYRVVRDAEGFMVGAEIRLSDECRAERQVAAKYRPLTSNGKHRGIKALSVQYGVIRASDKPTSTLLITEGLRKAQIASETLSIDAIGLRGINSWEKLIEDLPGLFPDVREVLLALDSDYRYNVHVERAREQILEKLKGLGYFDLKTIEWDCEQAKGIDDALLAGVDCHEVVYHISDRLDSLEQSAEEMREWVSNLLENPNGRVNLLDATVGSGKTQCLIDVINAKLRSGTWFRLDSGEPLRILWLVDNYEMLQQAEAQFIVPPARMQGRTYNPGSKWHCENKGEVDLAGAAHKSIMGDVCAKCPFLQTCKWIQSAKQVMEEESFVIAPKASFFNSGNRLEQFHVVICDESLTDALILTKTITKQDLSQQAKALQRIANDSGTGERKREEIDSTLALIGWFETEIELNQIAEQKLRATGQDILPVRKAVPGGFESVYRKHERMIMEGDEDGEHVKNFLGDLEAAAIYFVGDHVQLDVPQYELIDQIRRMTVITLDASPSLIKLQLLGKIEHKRFRVREYATYFQIRNFKGSRRQMDPDQHPDLVERVGETVDYLALTNPGEGLVGITTKAFAPILTERADKHGYDIDVGWYQCHDKGLNRFSSAKRYLIIGDPCPNITHLRMLAQTLEMMGVQTTLDDLIEEAACGTLLQSAGRARACRRKDDPPEIYFLTNRDMSKHIGGIVSVRSLETLRGDAYLDPQAGNKRKQERAEAKALETLNGYIQQGWLVAELKAQLKVTKLADQAGVDPKIMRRIMRMRYREQLAPHLGPMAEAHTELLEEIVMNLRLPDYDEVSKLGLTGLTTRETQILYKISLPASLAVMQRDSVLSAHLASHPPAGESASSWRRAIEAISSEGAEATTFGELGELIGLERRKASTWFKKLQNLLGAYLSQKQEDEVFTELPPIAEWDSASMENEAVLRIHLDQMAKDWHDGALDQPTIELLCQGIDQAVGYVNRLDMRDEWQRSEAIRLADAAGMTLCESSTMTGLRLAGVINDSTPDEYKHPAYYLEQLYGSLLWLQDDTRVAYDAARTIYLKSIGDPNDDDDD